MAAIGFSVSPKFKRLAPFFLAGPISGPLLAGVVLNFKEGRPVLGSLYAIALLLRDLRGSAEIDCADLESMFSVTPGEHQVIIQLVKGYSSREIAEQFGKSILTVRTHVKRAYGKIGVKTRGQLFAKLLPYLSIR